VAVATCAMSCVDLLSFLSKVGIVLPWFTEVVFRLKKSYNDVNPLLLQSKKKSSALVRPEAHPLVVSVFCCEHITT